MAKSAKKQHVINLHRSPVHPEADFINNENTVGISYLETYVIVRTTKGEYNLPKHATMNIFAGTLADGVKAHVTVKGSNATLRYWA
jgi:hypothetical protein